MASTSARERRINASNKRIVALTSRYNKAVAVVEEVGTQLAYERDLLAWVEQMPATATEAELPAEGELASEARNEAQEFVADPFSQTAGVNPELPLDSPESEPEPEGFAWTPPEPEGEFVGGDFQPAEDEPKRGRKAKAAAEG